MPVSTGGTPGASPPSFTTRPPASGCASPFSPIRPVGYTALTEIHRIEDFEAVVIYVIGLDAARPFRVLTYLDPPRVVVDVRTG